jgi:hypothetical protein
MGTVLSTIPDQFKIQFHSSMTTRVSTLHPIIFFLLTGDRISMVPDPLTDMATLDWSSLFKRSAEGHLGTHFRLCEWHLFLNPLARPH